MKTEINQLYKYVTPNGDVYITIHNVHPQFDATVNGTRAIYTDLNHAIGSVFTEVYEINGNTQVRILP